MNPTQDRIDFIKRAIAERRRLAAAERLHAQSAALSKSEIDFAIRSAEMSEHIADGMERALAILFP